MDESPRMSVAVEENSGDLVPLTLPGASDSTPMEGQGVSVSGTNGTEGREILCKLKIAKLYQRRPRDFGVGCVKHRWHRRHKMMVPKLVKVPTDDYLCL